MSEVADHPADSDDDILVSSHLQHPTLLPAVCPPFEEFFGRDRDVEFFALALLDACALARLSIVSKTWRVVAGDERLWEIHVRSDEVCSKWTSSTVAQIGSWRKYYSERARQHALQSLVFPDTGGPLTFADIWLTTGEIIWENVVGAFVPAGAHPSKQEHLWREQHAVALKRDGRAAASKVKAL